jgi:hypothetical protein
MQAHLSGDMQEIPNFLLHDCPITSVVTHLCAKDLEPDVLA